MVTGVVVVVVVVVYDAACGGCSAIAARLPDILTARVLVRSCRDPHLATEFPVLAGELGARPCRRPLLVVAGPRPAVFTGPAMVWRAARLVKPRRWPSALALAARILWTKLT